MILDKFLCKSVFEGELIHNRVRCEDYCGGSSNGPENWNERYQLDRDVVHFEILYEVVMVMRSIWIEESSLVQEFIDVVVIEGRNGCLVFVDFELIKSIIVVVSDNIFPEYSRWLQNTLEGTWRMTSHWFVEIVLHTLFSPGDITIGSTNIQLKVSLIFIVCFIFVHDLGLFQNGVIILGVIVICVDVEVSHDQLSF